MYKLRILVYYHAGYVFSSRHCDCEWLIRVRCDVRFVVAVVFVVAADWIQANKWFNKQHNHTILLCKEVDTVRVSGCVCMALRLSLRLCARSLVCVCVCLPLVFNVDKLHYIPGLSIVRACEQIYKRWRERQRTHLHAHISMPPLVSLIFLYNLLYGVHHTVNECNCRCWCCYCCCCFGQWTVPASRGHGMSKSIRIDFSSIFILCIENQCAPRLTL